MSPEIPDENPALEIDRYAWPSLDVDPVEKNASTRRESASRRHR